TGDKSYVTVPNKQMVDSILDNVSLRSQMRNELNLFLHLKTPSGKIRQLQEEIKEHLLSIEDIQNYNVVLNDIRLQGYFILVEFFTPPIDNSRFLAIKQQLNYFILNKMEELEIKIASEKDAEVG